MKTMVNVKLMRTQFLVIDSIKNEYEEIFSLLSLELANGNINEFKIWPNGKVYLNNSLLTNNINELLDQLEIAKNLLLKAC